MLSARLLLFAAFFFITTSHIAQARCSEGERESCGYQTQQVCGYRTEWVCSDKWIWDPDGGNCRFENQCGYKSVFSCKDEQVMVCECTPVPPNNPNPEKCLEDECSNCQENRRQFCGVYDRCRKNWYSGRWVECTPK